MVTMCMYNQYNNLHFDIPCMAHSIYFTFVIFIIDHIKKSNHYPSNLLICYGQYCKMYL